MRLTGACKLCATQVFFSSVLQMCPKPLCVCCVIHLYFTLLFVAGCPFLYRLRERGREEENERERRGERMAVGKREREKCLERCVCVRACGCAYTRMYVRRH